MKVEFLFPELYIYGDEYAPKFIKKCLGNEEYFYTDITDRPYFSEKNPDLLYLGALSERNQQTVINRLMPYKERIRELIVEGTHILFTSNALEILGKEIEDEGTTIPCLGIYDIKTKRHMLKRFNSVCVGKYGELDVIGYQSRFCHSYPGESVKGFIEVTHGTGMNPKCPFEGISENNLVATYLLGPFLVLNTPFTKKFLSGAAGREVSVPFEDKAMECHLYHLKEFTSPSFRLDI